MFVVKICGFNKNDIILENQGLPHFVVMHLETTTTSTRDRTCSATLSAIEWDIADFNLPQIVDINEFQMWPDGPMKLVYEFTKNERVRRHLSGWAMRNTNNHNRDILKKSCLGVLLCKENCIVAETGERIALRPAICDKARKKQMTNKCPNCGGNLILHSCKGNVGYPVTHYWRKDLEKIFFQSKGHHDHLRPDLRPHRDNRKKPSEYDLLYKDNYLVSTPDSSGFLKKESHCSTCLQYSCACQKNIDHLRSQLLLSRRPTGMFLNSYPYQTTMYNHQNYYKFPNYFIGQDQPHCLYTQDPFITNTALSYPPVIPATSLAFIKPDDLSISKQFQFDPFLINRYPSSYPTSLSTSAITREIQLNPINYSNARSSATCRYPAQEALSSNIQSANLTMPYFKY